jgi:hypothetical protein
MQSSATKLPRRCPLGVAFTTSGEPAFLFCKTWKCPRCAKKLAWKWAQRAAAAFPPDENGETVKRWFLTLTLSSYYRTPEQGFGALRKLWDTTRMAFQRANDNWQYLAFVEGQPERDDMPHFHILSAQIPPAKRNKKGQLTKRSLHDWAVGLGWGFEVDLKPVDSLGAAYYVSKYASKISPKHPANLRRVRASRDWPKAPAEAVVALILRKKNEHLETYLSRVSQFCDLSLYDLHTRYLEANENLAQMLDKV